MICQFTPELIHLDIYDFCRNQMLVTEMDMSQSLKSNLGETQIEQMKHRASVRLNNFFHDFESVALVVEGSDLGASEACFEPTASCINDTKKRQLVTRTSLSRMRCFVCHLHHMWAMNSPAAFREFFGTALQHVSPQG